MAYVVARPGRRFEVRESRATPRGPRARTLATFGVLDDEVLARVLERARAPLHVGALRRSARRAGAPVTAGQSRADQAARTLLTELRAARPPSPALGTMLATRLAVEGSRDTAQTLAGAAEWIGATPVERGMALRDLLTLTDRLPAPVRERPLPVRLGRPDVEP